MALLATTTTSHDYRTCDDIDCARFPCRVYKEGHDDGHDAGRAEGYGDGYVEGFSDGAASASH